MGHGDKGLPSVVTGSEERSSRDHPRQRRCRRGHREGREGSGRGDGKCAGEEDMMSPLCWHYSCHLERWNQFPRPFSGGEGRKRAWVEVRAVGESGGGGRWRAALLLGALSARASVFSPGKWTGRPPSRPALRPPESAHMQGPGRGHSAHVCVSFFLVQKLKAKPSGLFDS